MTDKIHLIVVKDIKLFILSQSNIFITYAHFIISDCSLRSVWWSQQLLTKRFTRWENEWFNIMFKLHQYASCLIIICHFYARYRPAWIVNYLCTFLLSKPSHWQCTAHILITWRAILAVLSWYIIWYSFYYIYCHHNYFVWMCNVMAVYAVKPF